MLFRLTNINRLFPPNFSTSKETQLPFHPASSFLSLKLLNRSRSLQEQRNRVRSSPAEYMPTQAKQPAAPNLKGFVRIQTQRSFGSGDKVQMTSHGCFLKDRELEISCCNCFALRVKKIKPNDCVTTVEGLGEKLRHDLILADLKKMLRCQGGTGTTKEASVVIWLHTEHGEAVEEFLWKSGLAAKDKMKRTSGV